MHTYFSRAQLLLATTAALALTSCSDKQTNSEQHSAAPIQVTLAQPSSGNAALLHLSGQVESSRSVNISTRIMGYITMLNVKAGDAVSKGQLLATISNEDLKAKRAQAEAMIAEANAALASAQKDYDRFTTLYHQQSATAKELDNATLQYNAAKARVSAARQLLNEVNANLQYSSLAAPFAGVVTQKLAEAGNLASPGMPILTIAQKGSYQVSATVPENSIRQLSNGTPATVSVQAAGKTIHGTVAQINPSAQASGQYNIKIDIPDSEKDGLLAGMYAAIDIQLQPPTATNNHPASITVPRSAIYQRDQLSGLYTVSNSNTALLRWVRLGRINGDAVEVVSGLGAGESYIVHAAGKLYDGAPVVPVK